MKRKLVSSGSYLEPIIGFSRAVRVGNVIAVGGTAPIAEGGGTACKGDVYGQTRRCIEISLRAIEAAGGRAEDVTRTRLILTDISQWREAARAHAETFGAIRPVTTMVAVSGFVDPDWLVETEMDCVISES